MWWRREIERRDGEQGNPAIVSQQPRVVPGAKAANPFVPIRVLPEEQQGARMKDITVRRQIEIVLPSGTLIRLDDGCDPGFVARLLSSLKA